MEHFPDQEGFVSAPGLEEVTIDNKHYMWAGKGGGEGVMVRQFQLSQDKFQSHYISFLNPLNASWEIFQDSRAKVGEDYPVLIKLGVEDGFPGGLGFGEGRMAARLLAQWGFDALEIQACGKVVFDVVLGGVSTESS